ncbi:unnamed protein product [Notodromas monacha]|uniref:Uncharacterized protein n=1 Tax=Notodromas monacha TaxID=399045 RepID=A0A7R9BV86_9CRUS|nr:unnamed protein product [Notodromas monacha]CAG0921028.1 unnamed protein product [Notodromas monacha]
MHVLQVLCSLLLISNIVSAAPQVAEPAEPAVEVATTGLGGVEAAAGAAEAGGIPVEAVETGTPNVEKREGIKVAGEKISKKSDPIKIKFVINQLEDGRLIVESQDNNKLNVELDPVNGVIKHGQEGQEPAVVSTDPVAEEPAITTKTRTYVIKPNKKAEHSSRPVVHQQRPSYKRESKPRYSPPAARYSTSHHKPTYPSYGKIYSKPQKASYGAIRPQKVSYGGWRPINAYGQHVGHQSSESHEHSPPVYGGYAPHHTVKTSYHQPTYKLVQSHRSAPSEESRPSYHKKHHVRRPTYSLPKASKYNVPVSSGYNVPEKAPEPQAEPEPEPTKAEAVEVEGGNAEAEAPAAEEAAAKEGSSDSSESSSTESESDSHSSSSEESCEDKEDGAETGDGGSSGCSKSLSDESTYSSSSSSQEESESKEHNQLSKSSEESHSKNHRVQARIHKSRQPVHVNVYRIKSVEKPKIKYQPVKKQYKKKEESVEIKAASGSSSKEHAKFYIPSNTEKKEVEEAAVEEAAVEEKAVEEEAADEKAVEKEAELKTPEPEVSAEEPALSLPEINLRIIPTPVPVVYRSSKKHKSYNYRDEESHEIEYQVQKPDSYIHETVVYGKHESEEHRPRYESEEYRPKYVRTEYRPKYESVEYRPKYESVEYRPRYEKKSRPAYVVKESRGRYHSRPKYVEERPAVSHEELVRYEEASEEHKVSEKSVEEKEEEVKVVAEQEKEEEVKVVSVEEKGEEVKETKQAEEEEEVVHVEAHGESGHRQLESAEPKEKRGKAHGGSYTYIQTPTLVMRTKFCKNIPTLLHKAQRYSSDPLCPGFISIIMAAQRVSFGGGLPTKWGISQALVPSRWPVIVGLPNNRVFILDEGHPHHEVVVQVRNKLGYQFYAASVDGTSTGDVEERHHHAFGVPFPAGIPRHLRCLTPEGFPGTCLTIPQCRFMEFQVGVASESGDHRLWRHLRSFMCGFERLVPKMCCPHPEERFYDFEDRPEEPYLSQLLGSGGVKNRPLNGVPNIPTPVVNKPRQEAECGQSPLHVRIVGGSGAVAGEWPWAAAVGRRDAKERRTSWGCGGALISTRHVLTAAHCLPWSTDNKKVLKNVVKVPNIPTPVVNKPRQEAECGQSPLHVRIVGGSGAVAGEWPWAAAVGRRDAKERRTSWGCGGALISTRHVLTAAHCLPWSTDMFFQEFLHQFTHSYVVRLGDVNILSEKPDDQPQDFAVVQAIPHEDYQRRPSFWNDIAVLKMDRDVIINDFVGPVCLPVTSRSADTLDRESFIAIGWGSNGTSATVDNLQVVSLPIVPMDRCKARYDSFGIPLRSTQICAGVQGKDTCKGDSGAPTMMLNPSRAAFEIVGITSIGSTACGGGLPGVYTKVDEYIDWIQKALLA